MDDVTDSDLPEYSDLEPLASDDEFMEVDDIINNVAIQVYDLAEKGIDNLPRSPQIEHDLLAVYSQYGTRISFDDGDPLNDYCNRIINGRWPEAEAIICRIPDLATNYAVDVIKGRWPEIEESISKIAPLAYQYSVEALRSPWVGPWKEQAEKTVAEAGWNWPAHTTGVAIDPETGEKYEGWIRNITEYPQWEDREELN